MFKHILFLATVLSIVVSTASLAGEAESLALARKSGCLACHNVDKKVVGPAWKDVAAKYKGKPDIKAQLVEKVKKGGKGNWGQVPMPPYSPRVADADIESLIDFVLSLTK